MKTPPTLYDEINRRPYERRGLSVPDWPLEKVGHADMLTVSDIRSAARIALRSLTEAGAAPEEKAAFASMFAEPSLEEPHRKLASVFFRALGKFLSRDMEKRANPVSWLPSAVSESARLMALVGLAGGSLLGGGAWVARRGLSNEDEATRRLEIQRDTYQRLAADIRAEMARRKLKSTPENVAAVADYLT
jgi:hypothetical protein